MKYKDYKRPIEPQSPPIVNNKILGNIVNEEINPQSLVQLHVQSFDKIKFKVRRN
jgi:hypothetical protein